MHALRTENAQLEARLRDAAARAASAAASAEAGGGGDGVGARLRAARATHREAFLSTLDAAPGPDGGGALDDAGAAADDDATETARLRAELEETRSSFCLLYTSPSPRDGLLSRMPSSA